MTTIFGIFLIVLSILVVCWGDKNIKTKKGKIVWAISMPHLNDKLVKWACGFISFLFHGGPLKNLILDFRCPCNYNVVTLIKEENANESARNKNW